MENDFLNVSKTKKIPKPKDNKPLKANKSIRKKKQNELNNIKFKNILTTINPKLSINNNTKYNINLNTKILSSTFDFNFDNIIFPPKFNEEQIINTKNLSNTSLKKTNNNALNNQQFLSLSQNESKYLLDEMHQSLYNKNNNIIKIQSHFRGFLVKKRLLIKYISRSYITKKSIEKIINIQKIIRSFLAKINIRKRIIKDLINQKRKKAIELIIKKLQDFDSIIKTKKSILINHLLEQRKLKAIFIQESFRNYLFYKKFQKLRESIETNYFLFYPFNAKKVDILLYPDRGAIANKK